jgi:hypothetical protein
MPWIGFEIQQMGVRETFAIPLVRNDLGGNPYPDCQRS